MCVCHIQVDLTNENADRVSRDLLGLELGEVGGALLRSPVSMQANTAAKQNRIFVKNIVYCASLMHLRTVQ